MLGTMTRPSWLAVTTLATVAFCGSAAAVDLKLERRSSPAGSARVCVTLDSKGADVAGTQNDLTFDSSCATLDPDKCVASEGHGKPLHGSIPANMPSTFRSLVFALDNVDPMVDGDVYCCDFALKEGGDACCAAELSGLGVSDPQGVALDVTAAPGRVCLAGDAGAPAAPVAKSAPETQSPAPAASAPSWVWVVLFAAAVMAILFFALRKAD